MSSTRADAGMRCPCGHASYRPDAEIRDADDDYVTCPACGLVWKVEDTGNAENHGIAGAGDAGHGG